VHANRTPRQFKEKFHRLAGGAVLRIVEVNAGPFGHHALAPVRVCSEQRLKMAVPDILGVDLEISPRGTLTERMLGGLCYHRLHVDAPFLAILALRRHSTVRQRDPKAPNIRYMPR
jgi:hypothetical protein